MEASIDSGLSRRVVISSLAFVLGFSTVFVALGATASAVSQFISDYMYILSKVAGAVIVVFGLHFMGLFRIAFLYREARFNPQKTPAGLVGAYVLGLAFAFGWTPCVGPILASILAIAASSDSVGYGVALLSVYAAGLGIPFLLAAFAVRPFMGFLTRFRRHLGKVEFVVGALLVLAGVLIFTDLLAQVSFWILEAFPSLGSIEELAPTDGFNVSYFAAAVAGLLSFLSPCVLPLVPAYLCFVAGTTVEELIGS